MRLIDKTEPWIGLYSYVIVEIPGIVPSYVILTNYPLIGVGHNKQPQPDVDAFYRTLMVLLKQYPDVQFHELIVPLPCATTTLAIAIMGNYGLHHKSQLWFYGNPEHNHNEYTLISPLGIAHKTTVMPLKLSLADIKIAKKIQGGDAEITDETSLYWPSSFEFESNFYDLYSEEEVDNNSIFQGGENLDPRITSSNKSDPIPTELDLTTLYEAFATEPTQQESPLNIAPISSQKAKSKLQFKKYASNKINSNVLMICLGHETREIEKVRLKAELFSRQITNGTYLLCLPLQPEILEQVLTTCDNCIHRQLHLNHFIRLVGLIAPTEIPPELEAQQIRTAQRYVDYASTYLPRGFLVPSDYIGQVITHYCREFILQFAILPQYGIPDFNLLYDIVSSPNNGSNGNLDTEGWTIAGCYMYSPKLPGELNRIYVGPRITVDKLELIMRKLGISTKITNQLIAFLCFTKIQIGAESHVIPLLIVFLSTIPTTISIYHWSDMVTTIDNVLIIEPNQMANFVYDNVRMLFKHFGASNKITESQLTFFDGVLECFNISDFKYTYVFARTSLVDFKRPDLIAKHVLMPLAEYGVIKDFISKEGRYKRLDMNVALSVSRAHPHTIAYLAQLADVHRIPRSNNEKKMRRQKIFDNLSINAHSPIEIFGPGKQLQIIANYGHLSITVTNYNSIENLIMILRLHCAIVKLLKEAHAEGIPIFNTRQLSSTIDQLTKIDPKRFIYLFDSPFSSHCQDKRQPRYISEEEFQLLDHSKLHPAVNMRAYRNATTHQKLYIVCSEPYSAPSIIPVSSTLERGAPCCNSQPAAKASMQAKLLELYFNNDKVPMSTILSIQNPKSIQNAHLISPLKKIEANKYYDFGSTVLQTYMKDTQVRLAMISLGGAIHNIELWPIHMLSVAHIDNPLKIIKEMRSKYKLLDASEIFNELVNIGLSITPNDSPYDEISKVLQLYEDLLILGHPKFEVKYLIPYLLEITKWLIFVVYNIIILELHENTLNVLRLRELRGLRAIADKKNDAPKLIISIKMEHSPLFSIACVWKQSTYPVSYFFESHLHIEDLLHTILSDKSLSAHHRLMELMDRKINIEAFYVKYGEVVYGMKCRYKKNTGFIPCLPFLFVDDMPAIFKAPINSDLFDMNVLAEIWHFVTTDKELPKWFIQSDVTNKIHLIASHVFLVPCKPHPVNNIPVKWKHISIIIWPHNSLPTLLRNEPMVPNSQIVHMMRRSPIAIRIAIYESTLINLNEWLTKQRDTNIREQILKDYFNGRLHATWMRYCRFIQDQNIIMELLSRPQFEHNLMKQICYFDMYWGFTQIRELSSSQRIDWLKNIVHETIDQITMSWELETPIILTENEITEIATSLSLIFNYEFMFTRLVEPRVCENRARILSRLILLFNTAQNIY